MTDVLGLTSFRQQVAAYLVDGLADDIGVFDAIPDSIAPPAVYVAWSNPWLAPSTFCGYVSTLRLIAVAQRLEPGGQYGVLESLVGDVVTILKDKRIVLRDVTAPYPINLGGVDYLAAALNVIQETGD